MIARKSEDGRRVYNGAEDSVKIDRRDSEIEGERMVRKSEGEEWRGRSEEVIRG